VSFLESLGTGLRKILDKISRHPDLDETTILQTVNEIEKALIKADVNLDLVVKLGETIKKRIKQEQPPTGITKRDFLIKIIYDELVNLLGGEKTQLNWPKKDRLYTILLVGLQGSGKTTTAAKLAKFYSKKGYKVGMIAADTYRPGAKDQLVQLGQKINVNVYTSESDSLTIIKEGLEFFKKQGYHIALIDTAGRHKDEKSLMDEMKKIVDQIKPDEVFLVIDATIGQQAKSQAEAFSKAVTIASITITKLDGSAKGGGALSAVAATNAKIRFIGTGEGIDDLELFDAQSFVSRLLGLGDLKSLIEKVKEAEINEKRFEEIVSTGKLTLLDFEYQIESMVKLGSFSKILGLLPGLSSLPAELVKNADNEIKRWKVILSSMTKEEKLNPALLNGSRIRRIAIGSGTKPEDVRSLLKRYELMKSQIKILKRNRNFIKKLGGAYKV